MSDELHQDENYIKEVARLKEIQDAMRRDWLIPLQMLASQVYRRQLEDADREQP